MNNAMFKKEKKMKFVLQARDVIALVILLGLFYCKVRGMDGTIDAAIALIIGYYFSKRVFEEKKK